MPYGTLNVDKIVNDNGVTFAGLYGFKNRIINGDMRIDQRNAGASVTITAGGVYPVDRFVAFEDTDGTMTAEQVQVAPTGFTDSLVFNTGTADTSLSAAQYCGAGQLVEGFNVADFGWGAANASTVTLSFWVRSSLTGTFSGSLRNSAADRSYVFTYSISAANTFEYKTITIVGDTSGTWLTNNGIGLRLWFSFGAGSTYSTSTTGSWIAGNFFNQTGSVALIGTASATFYITGVQLEKGSTATSFDYRPYGTELMLCQRYFAKTFPQTTAVAQNATESGALDCPINPTAGTAGVLWTQWVYPVIMRASPTITTFNPNAANSNWRNSSSTGDLTASTGQQSDRAVQVRAANVPSGQGAYIHLTASSEL